MSRGKYFGGTNMSEQYTGRGSLHLRGCAKVTATPHYSPLFEIGQLVYNLHKARQGVAEKIYIRRIVMLDFVGTSPRFSYVDNTHRVWLEWELLSETDGKIMIANYEENFYYDSNSC
jgi:hypothetical protein